MMPVWVQLLVGIASAVVAAGVIYTKALRPFVESVELLNEIRRDIGSQPEVFAVLNEIARQFRTNAGSSLRDIVDRLEAAATAARIQAEANYGSLEVAKILAEADRRTAARIEMLVNQVSAKADVAATAASVVATDLEGSHLRAEEYDVGSAPGEAADAAMRRPPTDTETPNP